jgi:hypothetical protein
VNIANRNVDKIQYEEKIFLSMFCHTIKCVNLSSIIIITIIDFILVYT